MLNTSTHVQHSSHTMSLDQDGVAEAPERSAGCSRADIAYPSPPPGQGAPRARIGRRRGRRQRRWRSRKDGDVELHAKPAVLAHRADEPPPAGLVQGDAVLAGAPDGGGRGLVARLEVRPAQLHHVVGALAVLERCKGLAKSDNLQMHGVARSE